MEISDRCMAEYSKLMGKYPVLSKKEEQELTEVINRYRENDAKYYGAAKEFLFHSNIRLVLKEAKRYKNIVPLEDLMGAGCEGLWIATEKFNPQYKTKFSTYAMPWIKLHLYRTLNSLGTMVYIPMNVKSQSYKYQSLIKKDKKLTDEELREELNVTQKGLSKIRLAQHKILSLDRTYDNDNGDGDTTLASYLPNEKDANPSLEIQLDERREVILEAMKGLSEVQRDILLLRYLDCDKSNLSTIGKKWNITGERVRQIEFQALKKMRRRLKSKMNFKVV